MRSLLRLMSVKVYQILNKLTYDILALILELIRLLEIPTSSILYELIYSIGDSLVLGRWYLPLSTINLRTTKLFTVTNKPKGAGGGGGNSDPP